MPNTHKHMAYICYTVIHHTNNKPIYAVYVNVARLTELKSELRDAERRQSAEIARQTEEIARLSQDVTWSAKCFSKDVKFPNGLQMAHEIMIVFLPAKYASCQNKDLFWDF